VQQDQQTHILIVDDSPDDLDMYTHYLSMKGYRVSGASDGKDGLGKALRLLPHLVILDLWLPIISGWEVMQRLKGDERTKHIPVLVVTAHSSVPTLESDGWLMKPCSPDRLGAEIARIV
jgi:DNA-binding response OmpR family regulator